MAELHAKYAPILRFNKNEHFFPMRLDDMLTYSSLHVKGETEPIVAKRAVTPDLLARNGRFPNTFLRTVDTGPLFAPELLSDWSESATQLIVRWAVTRHAQLNESLGRRLYHWFSPRTRQAASLFWWNGLMQALAESQTPNELPRLILPSETQQDALAQYHFAKPSYTYYYRQVKDSGYLCLQYWFFYSYNDWGRSFSGLNDHEGDWECMMLFFKLDQNGRAQEPPAYITFADHESRQTKPWGDDGVTLLGTHPVGFVGGGSHATYPKANTHPLMALYHLFDYATGDGVTIDHDDWVHRINLDDTPWLGGYKGSWGTRFWLQMENAMDVLTIVLKSLPGGAPIGFSPPKEVELPGVSAPYGPVGPHRPQYANPAAWAGVEK
ncbi:MAG: hypothetical protein R6X34_01790 [Chloroflexota bacterium]